MKALMILRLGFSFLWFSLMLSTVLGQQKFPLKADDNVYKVVVNHEEQYSILLYKQQTPKGSKVVRQKGSLKDCQAYIEAVWTDMRPLSVRQMDLRTKTEYQVVINHEEQYSILPTGETIPKGWKSIGISGSRKLCQAHIDKVWTDMRPLSLRKRLAR